ncbi:MAG: hypothetical protein K0Q50_710 [Vampirovibrio sp.]|jgi:hypothetical protein|nr:hypothetical protein [Vampirovibrio sp.]
MNREQEARLTEYAAAGKVSKNFTFWVLNKDTKKVSPILGNMVSGFLDEKTYELYEESPETPVKEAEPVENAAPVKKKKK